jgi:DNA-binding transcriptional LysR family regulator
MDIRQLQYLAALAREKHFTRAAQACHVTQPTLSGRIRQLEQELGVPIVERGHRFHGFTPDGERVLKWAHAILENWTALQQEIAALRHTSATLAGHLSFGVIPSALPMAALITKAIQARHPGVELTVLSQSSIDILRHLEDYSIDVGLTYLDNEPIEGMRSEAIYMERYGLLVRTDHPLAGFPSVTWAEAGQQPLCLLTPDMQNRRIVDRAFRAANSAPIPRLETNSVINLCANVRLMGLASVIPEYFLEVLGPISDVRAVPLTEPLIEHTVGLVAVDRDPVSPLVLAAFECARRSSTAVGASRRTDPEVAPSDSSRRLPAL